MARIAAVEAQLAAMGTPTTEYRRQFKSSSAWHVSVNGPFAEPSNRLRDRVVDEYRIVGEWRAASPTSTGPEAETCDHLLTYAHEFVNVHTDEWDNCPGPAAPERTEETP